MSNRRGRGYRDDDNNDTQRVDGRPRNSWATQAGLRGVHRNGRGEVIGAYTEDGKGWGNKADRGSTNGTGGWQGRMTGRESAAPATASGNGTTTPAAAPAGNGTAPATGNVLNARQNLFKQMTAAGSAALTPAMRAKAQSLGVTDQAFNEAAGRLKANEAITPPRPAAAPAATPSPPATPPAAGSTPPAPVSKINGIPAADAIAKARVGAERAWQGKVAPPQFAAAIARNNIATKGQAGAVADYFARNRTDNARPLVAAAAPVPATTHSPVPVAKPSWQQAVAPNAVSKTAAPAPKTGGLEGTIADINKTRAENASILKRNAPAPEPLETDPEAKVRQANKSAALRWSS